MINATAKLLEVGREESGPLLEARLDLKERPITDEDTNQLKEELLASMIRQHGFDGFLFAMGVRTGKLSLVIVVQD